MSKRAFDKIAAGLREALAVVRGEAKPYRITRYRADYSKEVTREQVSKIDALVRPELEKGTWVTVEDEANAKD